MHGGGNDCLFGRFVVPEFQQMNSLYSFDSHQQQTQIFPANRDLKYSLLNRAVIILYYQLVIKGLDNIFGFELI